MPETMKMNLRYTILSFIVIVLAFGFVVLPEKDYSKDLSAEEVLLATLNESRYLSTDKVASMLINHDPSLQLIDVRKPEEYIAFNLPGSINIPLDSLLSENADYFLNQNVKMNVFYSNGSIYANQAWLLAKRKGYKRVFLMRGGLNEWIETIIQPTEPKDSDDDDAFRTYQFRKGASQYFGGGSGETNNTPTDKKQLPVNRKTAKKSVSGGC